MIEPLIIDLRTRLQAAFRLGFLAARPPEERPRPAIVQTKAQPVTPARLQFDAEATAVLAPAMGRAYRALRRSIETRNQVDWAAARETVRRAYVQVWLVAMHTGTEAGRAMVLASRKGLDRTALARWWAEKPRSPDEVLRSSQAFDVWWSRQEPRLQASLRQAIFDAERLGKPPRWIVRQIKADWGPQRARLIAQTESTNIIGLAQQASFQQAGHEAWEWSTVNDRRVCPQCEALDGSVHPMSEPFGSAHPGCRCGPVPADAGGLTKRGLEAQIRDLEEGIGGPDQRTEVAIAIDPVTGREIWRNGGSNNNVSLADAPRDPGLIFTHNHPYGWTKPPDHPERAGNSFSIEDVTVAMSFRMAEQRVIAPGARFSMRPGPAGWPELDELRRVHAVEDAIIRADFGAQIRAGKMTPFEANAAHLHLLWTRVAKELDMIYERMPR